MADWPEVGMEIPVFSGITGWGEWRAENAGFEPFRVRKTFVLQRCGGKFGPDCGRTFPGYGLGQVYLLTAYENGAPTHFADHVISFGAQKREKGNMDARVFFF
jgi:hypothetical protein